MRPAWPLNNLSDRSTNAPDVIEREQPDEGEGRGLEELPADVAVEEAGHREPQPAEARRRDRRRLPAPESVEDGTACSIRASSQAGSADRELQAGRPRVPPERHDTDQGHGDVRDPPGQVAASSTGEPSLASPFTQASLSAMNA